MSSSLGHTRSNVRVAIRALPALPAPKLTEFINPRSTFSYPINDVYAGPVDIPAADLKAGERYIINFNKVGLTPRVEGCVMVHGMPPECRLLSNMRIFLQVLSYDGTSSLLVEVSMDNDDTYILDRTVINLKVRC